jgi:hypothetical protein
MAKLKGSDAEKILEKAGGVFGDKGFIGTDYITTHLSASRNAVTYCNGNTSGTIR